MLRYACYNPQFVPLGCHQWSWLSPLSGSCPIGLVDLAGGRRRRGSSSTSAGICKPETSTEQVQENAAGLGSMAVARNQYFCLRPAVREVGHHRPSKVIRDNGLLSRYFKTVSRAWNHGIVRGEQSPVAGDSSGSSVDAGDRTLSSRPFSLKQAIPRHVKKKTRCSAKRKGQWPRTQHRINLCPSVGSKSSGYDCSSVDHLSI